MIFPNGLDSPHRILLIGGTSEIGLAILAALCLPATADIILAGRDPQRLAAAGQQLPGRVRAVAFDAGQVGSHQQLVDGIFAEGPVDLVISAAGILTPQPDLERDVRLAAEMIETNFTGQVTTLLAVAGHLRAQRQGTIVVLSSVAAVRPRRANFVYGSTKSALDAFARGLADSLHDSGVRVVLVRPGFVTGRMTSGLPRAPLATTPEKVGAATAAALLGRRTPRSRPEARSRLAARGRPEARGRRTARRRREAVWVPAAMAGLAIGFRLVPRRLWRRLSR